MIERIAGRYAGRLRQGYVRGKLRSDPVFAAAAALLKDSPRPVLDVGCGLGLFAFYLRECGGRMPVTGFDFDARKIASARGMAAHYAGLEFSVGDAREARAFSGDVVVFDVLHYLPLAEQRTLLEHLAGCVAPGGMCLLRATPRDASWRFRVTQAEEFFLRLARWMKSGAVHFSTREEIVAPFQARGFACEVRPLWGCTPFNSYLFVLRRPS